MTHVTRDIHEIKVPCPQMKHYGVVYLGLVYSCGRPTGTEPGSQDGNHMGSAPRLTQGGANPAPEQSLHVRFAGLSDAERVCFCSLRSPPLSRDLKTTPLWSAHRFLR